MKTSRTFEIARRLTLVALLISLCPSTQAVILKGSGDPEANTTPPTGALQDSGWQYQGEWGSFLGTVIGPQYFIAAQHVGGAVGETFVFQGVSYQTTAFWDDPTGTDLRIWKVDGVFPIWAPLYSLSDELGKSLVVMGRGTQRGEAVVLSEVQTNSSTVLVPTNYTTTQTLTVPRTQYTTNVFSLKKLGISAKTAQRLYPTATIKGDTMTLITSKVVKTRVVVTNTVASEIAITSSTLVTHQVLKGWKAGLTDNRMRWGENQVTYAVPSFLVAAFDADGGPDEGYLSAGDSSGAVFILEGGTWKLAAINYGIEGPFKVSATDPSFYGALLDKSGLYQQMPADGQLRPASFYATRISPRLAWITTVLSQ